MDNIENDNCGKLFPLKNIIGRFHRKKKTFSYVKLPQYF